MKATPQELPPSFVYRNPLDLPRIGYADIVANTAEGVHVEQPEAARLFPRAPPVFHDDPDGAGLFPPFHELVVTYPPVFTVSLRNVTLVGSRSVLSRQGFFVNDLGHLTREEVSNFAKSLGRSDEIAHLVPLGEEGVFGHAIDGQPQMHLQGPVVVLTSAEAGNFGSFLYRELVKLVNLAEMPADWRFLIHIGERTYEQFLELAGLTMERVIRHDPHTAYHIDQAIIPGLRNPLAMADPQTRAFYDGLRAQCDSGARGRRLYISRQSISAARPTGRVMLNEAALIQRLRPLGFEIVETQYLTAAEQIATFASADLVVGPSGSGMFNAVFCRPGTKLIDIESEPHWIYPHCCLFASAGLHYGIFEGLAANRDWSVHHKPWQVNIEALLQRIAGFAAHGAAAGRPETACSSAEQSLWSVPKLAGENYRTVLQRLHAVLTPATYLEIGVGAGTTLELAACPAIAIDPEFRLERLAMDNKPFCCLYRTSSDAFFKSHSPSSIFGRPVEMAFLHGMHWFERFLRDFINVERHCKSNSIVLLQNCLPTDDHVARRDPDCTRLRRLSPHPDWWAGDAWKMAAILLKYRPDLKLVAFDAEPTGLVAVTRLDPCSTVLSDRYFDLLEEYREQTLAASGDLYLADLNVRRTQEYAHPEALSSFFWL